MADIPDAILDAIKKSWRAPYMRWLLPTVSAVAILAVGTDYGAYSLTVGNVFLAAAVAAVAHGAWLASNRMPRVPANQCGIVVAIRGEDEREDIQIKADFIQQLRQLLEPDRHSTRFNLLVLPPHFAERCIDGIEATKVLMEARGHFMIYGSVRRRTVGGRETHILALEGVIRHSAEAPEARAQIVADFRQALPRRVHVPIENDAFGFEATSEWIEVAARYVIGLAALASRDVWYAETLLLSAEERLKKTAPRFAPLRDISRKLPGRFENLYSSWLGNLSQAYYITRRREFVEEAEGVARKLLARNPDHYAGHLQMAIAHFVLRRDLAAARREIAACRRVRDVTWRYSRAFLLAYEGQTKRAREEYNEAFRGRLQDITVPVQVEEFIQLVLEEEEVKVQLHFFLGLINLKAKEDTKAAARDFAAFLADPRSSEFPEERVLAEGYLEEIERQS